MPISAIVLTKNEAEGIAECLRRLENFDEVIVVDSHSVDDTAAIAQEFGAKVVQFSWDGTYPKKKQWALENSGARNNWVLLLDADESPTAELIDELHARTDELQAGTFGAYDLVLHYKFAGRFLDHGHRVVKRSLLDTRVCRFPEVDDLDAPGIREVEGHYQPQSEKPIGRLRGRLSHDDKDPVGTWFDRHNRYAEWEAHLLATPGTGEHVAANRSTLGRVWARVPAKPLVFFVYSYVIRLGFLDGRAGRDYAIALSGYYWQIGVKYREQTRLRSTQVVAHVGAEG
ncbi:glycosyltransferase family 2 protein [Demequina phytophila]|uniref:glycosyltransferase family 2 protein n=1 Tax=Demequina phytophila TaxID=1638981 RepID=UPI000AF8E78B|nr:glycosyltransferase family 2 protein [Demequina phytophila]